MPTVVLPESLVNKDVSVIRLQHPRTGKLAKFVVDENKVYQLLVVDERAHKTMKSLIVGSHAYQDASLTVMVPLHPVFLLLPALYKCRGSSMPLDVLLDMDSSDDADVLPGSVIESNLQTVCAEKGGCYELDMDKLETFLRARTDKLAANLPASLSSKCDKLVSPTDPTQQLDAAMQTLARLHAATLMVCEWLPTDLVTWFEGTIDFGSLEAHVDSMQQERASILATQMLANPTPAAKKRSSTSSNGKAKKAKVENNRSMLDFFKPKGQAKAPLKAPLKAKRA